MKKFLFGITCILFIYCLTSCNFILQDSKYSLITNSFMITLEQYDSLRKKYSLDSDKDYIVFNNYDDFILLYGQYTDEDVHATFAEEQQEIFKKHKKFCFVRKDKIILTVGYVYYGKDDAIKKRGVLPYNDSSNEKGYFIDFVDVPNNIYKRLNK